MTMIICYSYGYKYACTNVYACLQFDDDSAHLTLMKDAQIPQMQFLLFAVVVVVVFVAGITSIFMGRHGQVFSLSHMLIRDILSRCR